MPDPQTSRRVPAAPPTFPAQSGPNNLSHAQEHELITTFRLVEETSRLTEISRQWSAELGGASDTTRDERQTENYRALLSDYRQHVERFHREGQSIVARNHDDVSPNARIASLDQTFSDTVQKLDALIKNLDEKPSHHTLKETAAAVLELLSGTKQTAVSHFRGLVGNISAKDLMWEIREASIANRSLGPLLNQLEKRAYRKFDFPESPFASPGPGTTLEPEARMEILNTAAALRLAAKMGAAFEMRTTELAHPAATWNTEVDQLGFRAVTPMAYLQNFEENVGRYRDFLIKASQTGPNGQAIPPEVAAKSPLGQLGQRLGEVSAEMAKNRANLLIAIPNPTLFEYTGLFLSDQHIAQDLYRELYSKLSGVLRNRGIEISLAGDPKQHHSSAAVDLIDALRKSTPTDDAGTRSVIDSLEQYFAKGFPPDHARWYQLVLPPKK